MTTSTRTFVLSAIIALVLSACNWGNTTPTVNGNPVVQATATLTPALSMAVNYNATIPYNTVGQEVSFSYLVGNASGASIPGPVTVTDDRIATVTCPDLTLVGNQDTNLDADEALSCTGVYTITQLDLDAGSFSKTATASASGNFSSTVTTTVTLEQTTRALTLTKTASQTGFNSVGETITYNYVITNSGNVSLGPIQFVVNDNKMGAAINCGPADTTLTPNATVACSANYIITDADLTAGVVTNSASATDGTTTSGIVTATINKGSVSNPSNLTPGSTIQHQVVAGEWLWQIARCYGADPKQVVLANSQLSDPAKIPPGITVSVPNIGDGGTRTIYGPPCVGTHTVQSGDTWASIAQLHNADTLVLQDVNPGALSPGRVLKVPLNSAGNQ